MSKNILIKVICILLVAAAVMMGGCANRPTVPRKPTYPQTEGEFQITISADKETFEKSTNIEVEAVFRNLSGRGHEIEYAGFYLVLMRLVVVKYDEPARPDVSTLGFIEQDAEIYQEWTIGSKLQRGKYQLVADAKFSLIGGQSVTVYSNTIILTVI